MNAVTFALRRERTNGHAPVGGLAAVGFLGGFALGMLVASQQLYRHRRNLFSPRAYERLAALAYLGGQHSLDTLRLLHDYIGWETRPLLRRRGVRLLRQLERHLD